ncbi:hypothetical protein HYFRA_00011765 [Hymenoscyphus fraxineus]|uniref:Nucleoporin POM33 n=1 Tax=Hymenoscyphus fraxineus TaxID=746836 RepID=A0A9N9L3I6_9HELO|nr:hypothetical protein HYFRA_00011765 [Hymenoscyphus fraxineus]
MASGMELELGRFSLTPIMTRITLPSLPATSHQQSQTLPLLPSPPTQEDTDTAHTTPHPSSALPITTPSTRLPNSFIFFRQYPAPLQRWRQSHRPLCLCSKGCCSLPRHFNLRGLSGTWTFFPASCTLRSLMAVFAGGPGHLTLLFCIVRYGFSYLTFNYYSRMAVFSYRTSFVSAAVTYGIVVYKAFRARSRAGSRAQGGIVSLIADENVQYLAMALVWLFSAHYPLAMLPFGVYSIFHVATYARTNLIPTIQPQQQAAPAPGSSPNAKPVLKTHPLADTIGRFVKEYYDASMGLVAILEIMLWGRLLLSALLFQRGSWILITIYTAFLRARFAQSSFVQTQFRQLEGRIDSLAGGQSTPPAARQAWEVIKSSARTFHDATDVGHYVNKSPAAKKAS